MTEYLPIIGLLISIVGIVSAISYKFYRDTRKDNSKSGFDKGKLETIIEFLKENIKDVENSMKNFQDDIEKGHMDYDSMQKQIGDIRERLARMEGPR